MHRPIVCPPDGVRRGITGIVLAVLLFATLFVAGVGYFAFESQAAMLANNGGLSREGEVHGANSEDLLVTTSKASSGPYLLVVNAYNAGGVAATITAVSVISASGKALSNAPLPSPSEFLLSPPYLSINLPLTLMPGESSSGVKDCGQPSGCNIGIDTALACPACLSGQTVYVNLLTSRGNSFAGQYPQLIGTVTESSPTSTSTVSQETITSVSTMTISSTLSVTTASSVTTGGGFQAGTNSLLLEMEGCAGSPATLTTTTGTTTVTTTSTTTYGTSTCVSPQPVAVYQGGEIILNIPVTNLASTSINTYVSFQFVGTNGAGVSGAGPDDCASGQSFQTPTQPITAGSTYVFTCTFSATQGPTGGTVTFIGYAVGTTSTTTSGSTMTSSSGEITSAEAVSNPIQVGNPGSAVTGAFVPISFDYASEESVIFTPATTIPAGTSDYVIFQAQLQNTANSSLTILEYTFLLNARVAQEEDYYMVSSVPEWTSTTLTAYGCELPSSPSTEPPTDTITGQNCVTVPSGSDVTIDLAACAAGTTDWFWEQTNSGGNGNCPNNDSSLDPPEATTAFVIVVYDYYNSALGRWSDFAQAIAISGIYFT